MKKIMLGAAIISYSVILYAGDTVIQQQINVEKSIYISNSCNEKTRKYEKLAADPTKSKFKSKYYKWKLKQWTEYCDLEVEQTKKQLAE